MLRAGTGLRRHWLAQRRHLQPEAAAAREGRMHCGAQHLPFLVRAAVAITPTQIRCSCGIHAKHARIPGHSPAASKPGSYVYASPRLRFNIRFCDESARLTARSHRTGASACKCRAVATRLQPRIFGVPFQPLSGDSTMAKRYGSWLSKRRRVAPQRLSCQVAPTIFPAAANGKDQPEAVACGCPAQRTSDLRAEDAGHRHWGGRRRVTPRLSFRLIHSRSQRFTGGRQPGIRAARDARGRW